MHKITSDSRRVFPSKGQYQQEDNTFCSRDLRLDDEVNVKDQTKVVRPLGHIYSNLSISTLGLQQTIVRDERLA